MKETDNIIINYSSLLNTADVIRDNSCLMLLTLLSKLVPARVYIAGMDGYKDSDNNYYREYLAVKHNVEQAHILNEAISRRLEQLNHLLDIEFITPTLYIK